MTGTAAATERGFDDRISEVLKAYWGFDALRPLQAEAIAAGIEQRDSLVVMPTGGGKSLCYQVPPLVADRTDIVISPLISLMKDQVDSLRACGYPASALHSNLDADERRAVFERLHAGEDRLLFVSPERLVASGFIGTLERLDVRAFAIDEAHCISHWGHDFRPEYRQLSTLKDRFPQASVHAFTATATPRVRQDIAEQLRLDEANILVGTFDRPNLTYRITPRVDLAGQVLEIVGRHSGEAVIVYCITRKDTEHLATVLQGSGVNAKPYHAGLSPVDRRRTQEAFSTERLDVVVATVAFGMGIDRSNVRCVVHAAMPKSIEHYQQETGRAGRDGLEAECVLLYSAADVLRWKGLVERAEQESGAADGAAAQLELLRHMQGLCSTLECRHAALGRYFGQEYEAESCGACDVCLNEVTSMADSTVTAQKIMSCVARMGERFGVGQVVQVLRGAETEAVRRYGQEQLSTYGILAGLPEKSLTNLVYQLVDQNLLVRTPGDRPIIQLGPAALPVLRGEREVHLVEPKAAAVRRSRADEVSWEGVDEGLFETLRGLRRSLAEARQVPPYIVFGDAVLRDLARQRPTSPALLRSIRGIGERKLREYGADIVEAITTYCTEHGLDVDLGLPAAAPVTTPRVRTARANPGRDAAQTLFAKGASLTEVTEATGRTMRTVVGYLVDHIEQTEPEDVRTWVDDDDYHRVVETAATVGAEFLKPIYEALDGAVSYEAIRVVLAHRRTKVATPAADDEPGILPT